MAAVTAADTQQAQEIEARWQAGQTVSLEEKHWLVLHRRHLIRFVARAVWKRTQRHYEMDDLIQEGMLGALQGVAHWQPSRGSGLPNCSLSHWISRCARHQMYTCIRRRSNGGCDVRTGHRVMHYVALDAVEMSMIAMAPEAQLVCERRELTRIVEEIIRELTPRHRDVVTRIYWDEESSADAARGLDRPQGTVRRQHREALHTLREQLLAIGVASSGALVS